MNNYDLSEEQVETAIDQYLFEVLAEMKENRKNPILVINTAGSGAGKTGIEIMSKRKFGQQVAIVSSDNIAIYHPYYEQIIKDELPEDRYKITREFVKKAKPKIYEQLIKYGIGIIHEKIFSKPESSIAFVKMFKDKGYKVIINAMATDLFVSRLSCYKRDKATIEAGKQPRGIEVDYQIRTHNCFMPTIIRLQEMGLCDEVNVYTRGEQIESPKLVYAYSINDDVQDFEKIFTTSVENERSKQRKAILQNPEGYFGEIDEIIDIVKKSNMNDTNKFEKIEGLKTLKEDLEKELLKERSR